MTTEPTAPRTLITAGPTHEPIDAVRYIGNRSSGRMGIALANDAAARGWPVTLLLGPIGPINHNEGIDSRVIVRRFRTSADLASELTRQWPDHDLLLMAAAVADFRPAHAPVTGKLPRGAPLTLTLEPVPDLVRTLCERFNHGTVVAFALESEGTLMARAAEKLRGKGCRAIVANPLETMESQVIRGSLLCSDGRVLTPPAPASDKRIFAQWLLDQVPLLMNTGPGDAESRAERP